MTHLLLTVRFLDDRYHGLLARGGPPEWPPSPFRLFQALVAGVARRGELDTDVGKSLEWLQMLDPPIIIAPKSKTGQAITHFVPNNDGDSEKFRKEPEKCRTAKSTIPTLFLLEPDQKPEVHYLWNISRHADAPVDRIRDVARSLTTLGWGIDMAFADARRVSRDEVEKLPGVRWHPKPGVWRNDGMLRTPVYDQKTEQNSLCDLKHCHETAINRIEHGKPLKTVDKPKIFDRVFYSSVERPIGRPTAIFKLLDPNEDTYRYPHAKLIHIAGMVKHLAIELMKRNPPRDLRGRDLGEWGRAYVSGHQSAEDKEADLPHTQFSYIPLQSIGTEHTDPSVRRVMIVAPVGDDAWCNHLARQLDGELLKPLPNTTLPSGTRLERIDDRKKDGVRDAYLHPSRVWASVTPVILDKHVKLVKRLDKRTGEMREVWNHDELICETLKRAGIEQSCEFEWSAFSHFPKMLGAHKYIRDESVPDGKRRINYILPDHQRDRTAVHVVIHFGRREDPDDENSRWIPAEHPVPGPITLGAGRHCGFGLMAGIDP